MARLRQNNTDPCRDENGKKHGHEGYIPDSAQTGIAGKDEISNPHQSVPIRANMEPRDWLSTRVRSAAIIPMTPAIPRMSRAEIQNAITLQKPSSFGLTNVPTHRHVRNEYSLRCFRWPRSTATETGRGARIQASLIQVIDQSR